jgi:hypothetical protein
MRHSAALAWGMDSDRLRNARRQAHSALSILWLRFKMSPGSAHRWAASVLGIAEAHVGELSEAQCYTLAGRVLRFVATVRGRDHGREA